MWMSTVDIRRPVVSILPRPLLWLAGSASNAAAVLGCSDERIQAARVYHGLRLLQDNR